MMRSVQPHLGAARLETGAGLSKSTGRLAYGVVISAAMFATLGSLAARRDPAPSPSTTSGVVVVRGPNQQPTSDPPAAASQPRAEPKVVAASPEVRSLILASLADVGASLHEVEAKGEQVYCGEVSTTVVPQHRRFVWLASTHMLATDDGSADFADVARLCGR